MKEIVDKIGAWLTSGNTSAYVVIVIIVLIALYFIYKFRKSDIVKDIIANILFEEEKNALKGEGKIIEVAKKVRDKMPKFLSVLISDRTLKKLISEAIDSLQEKLDVDEISREIDNTRNIIEAYEIIRDKDCDTEEMKAKVQERIDKLYEKLEKLKEC